MPLWLIAAIERYLMKEVLTKLMENDDDEYEYIYE